jgi:hypothetical protein
MKRTEHQEQVALFQWMRMQHPKITIFAIPNAAKRSPQLANYMKSEGLMAGVADIFLMKAVGKYHGLFIEMKSQSGTVSDSQKKFLDKADAEGYATCVCYSYEEAKEIVEKYLQSK